MIQKRQEAIISYDIDEYDERFLRHLALGYTKEMIANLRGMPFGVKSLEKRQNDLVGRLFPLSERVGVKCHSSGGACIGTSNPEYRQSGSRR